MTTSIDTNLPVECVQKSDPNYAAFHHVSWYVGNSLQAASFFVTRFGFRIVAYRGPETGSPLLSSYVVANGGVRLVFTAPVTGPDYQNGRASGNDRKILKEIHEHLTTHGDGVKDIAFEVHDVRSIWEHATANEAESVCEPTVTWDDNRANGKVITATIATFGSTMHSLVDRSDYRGIFLPGYQEVSADDPINALLPPINYIEIDHCVGNQPWNGLDKIVKYYENALDFHRFWTVDDKSMCSDYSAMRSIVVASPGNVIKMPLNEPAAGLKQSQIEEFVNYYNGAGCQHIAFRTHDIIATVCNLKKRGVRFLRVPPAYYEETRKRLASSSVTVAEDINILQMHNILIDYDEGGYLLQIFAKHVVNRPTVFIEIIQRKNFTGFGAGNFKSLFEAFEREQEKRGNY
ncbi:Glyoxalase/Bleomycin resistance protein/Dihydroxybiphenyl dioxygenase [Aspergillus tamarii]|uniref:4-hydroxyphenylpyruvate dioxygenase n=1 Tax=Aspergillus tamarii TaxID=41984 RepID=A0A5N6UAI6_ASPTM|nr:Glyoxalase/Bleomycin resistance protein/Dihydroxybiphenyl dioxygenase [Aspergillus tamarii]